MPTSRVVEREFTFGVLPEFHDLADIAATMREEAYAAAQLAGKALSAA